MNDKYSTLSYKKRLKRYFRPAAGLFTVVEFLPIDIMAENSCLYGSQKPPTAYFAPDFLVLSLSFVDDSVMPGFWLQWQIWRRKCGTKGAILAGLSVRRLSAYDWQIGTVDHVLQFWFLPILNHCKLQNDK